MKKLDNRKLAENKKLDSLKTTRAKQALWNHMEKNMPTQKSSLFSLFYMQRSIAVSAMMVALVAVAVFVPNWNGAEPIDPSVAFMDPVEESPTLQTANAELNASTQACVIPLGIPESELKETNDPSSIPLPEDLLPGEIQVFKINDQIMVRVLPEFRQVIMRGNLVTNSIFLDASHTIEPGVVLKNESEITGEIQPCSSISSFFLNEPEEE